MNYLWLSHQVEKTFASNLNQFNALISCDDFTLSFMNQPKKQFLTELQEYLNKKITFC